MRRTICLFTLALTIACVLLLPPVASLQGFGAAEQNTALQGTNLTYHQRPTVGQCQADCANNANCKGFTWIQAGTYNASDPAMCYLMSAVTGRSSARGHFSVVKGSGGTSFGAREDNTSLNGTRLTYHPRASFDQCQADCANNPNCKGFTWIQAGTYNPSDQAMCYLMSAVTGRASARGHYSAVKGATGGGTGGGCKLEGRWTQNSEGGSTAWQITSSGQATEEGGGTAKGDATLTGRTLRINWKAPSGYAGYYEWTLNESCTEGSGTLVFTQGTSGSRKSTVRRN